MIHSSTFCFCLWQCPNSTKDVRICTVPKSSTFVVWLLMPPPSPCFVRYIIPLLTCIVWWVSWLLVLLSMKILNCNYYLLQYYSLMPFGLFVSFFFGTLHLSALRAEFKLPNYLTKSSAEVGACFPQVKLYTANTLEICVLETRMCRVPWEPVELYTSGCPKF